jgi:hypothetical protein
MQPTFKHVPPKAARAFRHTVFNQLTGFNGGGSSPPDSSCN